MHVAMNMRAHLTAGSVSSVTMFVGTDWRRGGLTRSSLGGSGGGTATISVESDSSSRPPPAGSARGGGGRGDGRRSGAGAAAASSKRTPRKARPDRRTSGRSTRRSDLIVVVSRGEGAGRAWSEARVSRGEIVGEDFGWGFGLDLGSWFASRGRSETEGGFCMPWIAQSWIASEHAPPTRTCLYSISDSKITNHGLINVTC
jgi:hypothetical protein